MSNTDTYFHKRLGSLHNQDTGFLQLPLLPSGGKELFTHRDGIVLAEFSGMVWICQHWRDDEQPKRRERGVERQKSM
jgi:hypothetical protein